MIDWREEAVVLAVRRHGETSVIAELFTQAKGRHAGLVRGGTSRKMAPILQPGAQVDASWRARLDTHLGTLAVEPVRSRAAQVMNDRLALAGLNAVTAILSSTLPERDPHPPLYHRTIALLDLLGQGDVWPLAYLQWELALLSELGKGLDLTACAVTGATTGLTYVSPKTGRAVSAEAAGEWAKRLLPLPAVLRGEGEATVSEIIKALGTTGYFLAGLAADLGQSQMPPARDRLIDQLRRLADETGP